MEVEHIEKNSSIKTESTKNISENKKLIFVISKCKKVKNWTKEEDELLMKTAKKFKFRNWNKIATFIEGRTSVQCTARYKRIKPGIIKGAWTKEEDELLKNLLEKYGKNWSTISRFMPSRNGKQIRDRFLNSLDPNILRDKFTKEEDNLILQLYSKYGSSWSQISKEIPGRTPDLIKNRFYSTLRKQVHCWDYLESLKKRKLARERVAILKNNKNNFKINNIQSTLKNFNDENELNSKIECQINLTNPSETNTSNTKSISICQEGYVNNKLNNDNIINNVNQQSEIIKENEPAATSKTIENTSLINFANTQMMLNNFNFYQNLIYQPYNCQILRPSPYSNLNVNFFLPCRFLKLFLN